MRFFDKYKEKRIAKLEKSLENTKEESGSSVFMRNIVAVILDVITWLIIAYFVWIWWQARGAPVGCDRITANLCSYCFQPAKALLNVTTGGLI